MEDNQHSLLRSLVLHLLPGGLILLFFVVFAPLLNRLGFPSLFAQFLAVAFAMPPDSLTICCDVSEEWTDVAQRYWQRAGVADKIRLHLQPATETLGTLVRDGQAGSFDFAFIDADKSNYDNYYEHCLTLLRSGGLIAVDNVLWSGAVVDAERQDGNTQAIRALNSKIRDDQRVDLCMVPIGDGLTLACKR